MLFLYDPQITQIFADFLFLICENLRNLRKNILCLIRKNASIQISACMLA